MGNPFPGHRISSGSSFTLFFGGLMKKNEILNLKAENLGIDMEGVCRHEGMAVFVPGLLPGEEAPVRIVKVENRFAFGKMESAPVSPSPDRRDPGCSAYPQCGGCSCRHLSYAATLEAKRRLVQDAFQRIGKISVQVPPVLGMDHPYAYRNKASLPVGGTPEQPVLGFFAPRSHRIIPAEACPNAMPPIGKIAQAFLSWMKKYRIEPYRESDHTGLVRHLVIRSNRAGAAMVTVVINGTRLPRLAELREAVEPLGAVSLTLNLNTDRTNVILSDRFQYIYGEPTLPAELCGLRFSLSPGAFFQINPFQTERLYETALSFADLTPGTSVCDVYCGAGTISLMLARHCRQVTGIEIIPDAVENARANAARNHIGNAVFHAGRAEDLLPAMVKQGFRPDVIVVDPPRKGLDLSVLDAVAQAGPSRVVYVSCNPATLARDASLFSERGFSVQKIQPVDMFPFTSHVETVVLMSRKDT